MWMCKSWFWSLITPTLYICTTKRGIPFKSLLWLDWINSISMQDNESQMIGLTYKIDKKHKYKKEKKHIYWYLFESQLQHTGNDFLPENKKKSSKKSDIPSNILSLLETNLNWGITQRRHMRHYGFKCVAKHYGG